MRIFGEWALGMLTEYPLLYRKIAFSEKAQSWLNDALELNKHKSPFWNDDQPEALYKPLMNPEKVTAWCGLSAIGITGPYFFKYAVSSVNS